MKSCTPNFENFNKCASSTINLPSQEPLFPNLVAAAPASIPLSNHPVAHLLIRQQSHGQGLLLFPVSHETHRAMYLEKNVSRLFCVCGVFCCLYCCGKGFNLVRLLIYMYHCALEIGCNFAKQINWSFFAKVFDAGYE